MREMIFVGQNIALVLFFPVFIAMLLGIAGLIMWRRPKLSFGLLAAGTAWLLIMSFPLTSLVLIRALESKAGHYADPRKLSEMGIRYVLVLSGDFRDGDLTTADKLGNSVLRLIEGVRLWRAISGCTLILTGGEIPGVSREMSIARAMQNMAAEMGVPRDAIVLESESWRTEDQARLTAAIVGNHPFALVTSAYHMQRSILIFRELGLSPVPAPCDFLAKTIYVNYSTLMPQAVALAMSQTAIREYLATYSFLLKTGFQNALN